MQRSIYISKKALIGLALAATNHWVNAQVHEKEMAIPLPAYAPRASASVVICTPSANVNLSGKNEGAANNPLKSAAIVGGVSRELHPRQFMRLDFHASSMTVALGTLEHGVMIWSSDAEYKVLSDVPEDFVAIRKGSGEPGLLQGMLQTVVLNRVTGTAISTFAIASLPTGAHPSLSATFFVCQPKQG